MIDFKTQLLSKRYNRYSATAKLYMLFPFLITPMATISKIVKGLMSCSTGFDNISKKLGGGFEVVVEPSGVKNCVVGITVVVDIDIFPITG